MMRSRSPPGRRHGAVQQGACPYETWHQGQQGGRPHTGRLPRNRAPASAMIWTTAPAMPGPVLAPATPPSAATLPVPTTPVPVALSPVSVPVTPPGLYRRVASYLPASATGPAPRTLGELREHAHIAVPAPQTPAEIREHMLLSVPAPRTPAESLEYALPPVPAPETPAELHEHAPSPPTQGASLELQQGNGGVSTSSAVPLTIANLLIHTMMMEIEACMR